jgi:hypothetical protein
MIALIIQLLIIAVVLGLVIWLVEQIPGVAPFANIIRVVAIVIFVIYLLYILMGLVGGGGPIHMPR